MKNLKKTILFTIIIITLFIITFFSGQVFSQEEKITENNSKVLENLERKDMQETEILEETIEKHSDSLNILLNDKSKEMLQLYDVPFDLVSEIETVRDNKSDTTISKVTLDNKQIYFDETGNITKIINNDDISTIDKDKRDYDENETLQQTEYPLKEKEDIQYILDEITDIYDLNDYRIVDCNNDLIGTWNVTWNKILSNNIINPYDVVNICIDAKDGSIAMFSRQSVLPSNYEIEVTEDEAISLASSILNKMEYSGNVDASLTVFRPNFYWEDGGPYEEADFVRIAWKVETEGKDKIMVDATSGEILGGDQVLTDGARAMSLVPTFYNAASRSTLAANAFVTLGYTQPYGCQPHTGWVTKADVMWVFNHPSLYGLFISCHGVENSSGSFANAISDGVNWTVYSSEVSGNWHFVYLAGCLTSSTSAFPNALHINGYTGRAFVGNNNSVNTVTSYTFIAKFFPKLGSMSVHSAVIQARNETIASGYTDCNPGFWGDINYYGWAW